MHSRKPTFNDLVSLAIFLVLGTTVGAFAAAPLGTTFTYQGRLTQSGSPVDGNADFQFSLWDGPAPGTQVTPILPSTTLVTDGTFTVDLNFGAGVFNGDERWLEIAVRFPAGGGGSFTTLTPRQRLNAAPYALALPGMFTQPNATSPNIIGGFSGNIIDPSVVGATISGGGQAGEINSVLGFGAANAFGTAGDFGTIGGGRDNTARIDATVGGGRSNSATGERSTIGGGSNNVAQDSYSTVGGGDGNSATNIAATVGGGQNNTASLSSATVSGGVGNTASGFLATIGGGGTNLANGLFNATVAGGSTNTAAGHSSTVGGGRTNSANGDFSVVAGGSANVAGANSATVGGGFTNSASGSSSTVAGGSTNTASGSSSTVAGGGGNTASGSFSFAAGRRAKADANGAFVWGDSTNADVFSGGTNTFNVRASGGTAFYSNAASTIGVLLAPGSGSWSGFSDRAGKSNVQPVDPRIALQKVVQLPISTWNYKAQDESIRHIGPMAQDFHAAFGVGEDDKHITTIDADGVALAAIQGLHQIHTDEISRLRETAAAQASELADLKAQLRELRALLELKTQSPRTTVSSDH